MVTRSCASLVLALAPLAFAAPAHFEVKSLPGWDGPLLTKTYCGFASAGVPPSGQGEMHFNYIFLESENDPANDPVIVWYNGGPGAASMFGLFVELGPYYLNQDSLDDPRYNATGIPQVQNNPSSWTKIANVMAVNNPPPIGFSYCDGQKGPNTGPSGDGYSCGPWNDTTVRHHGQTRGAACLPLLSVSVKGPKPLQLASQLPLLTSPHLTTHAIGWVSVWQVAKANHAFLKNLFSSDFKEFAKNPMFITGESYAGDVTHFLTRLPSPPSASPCAIALTLKPQTFHPCPHPSPTGIYVPTIVREIYNDPGPLNLAGFAVGDGCMGTEVLYGNPDPDPRAHAHPHLSPLTPHTSPSPSSLPNLDPDPNPNPNYNPDPNLNPDPNPDPDLHGHQGAVRRQGQRQRPVL